MTNKKKKQKIKNTTEINEEIDPKAETETEIDVDSNFEYYDYENEQEIEVEEECAEYADDEETEEYEISIEEDNKDIDFDLSEEDTEEEKEEEEEQEEDEHDLETLESMDISGYSLSKSKSKNRNRSTTVLSEGVTIINSKKNGKRLELSKKLMKNLGDPSKLQFAYGDDEIAISESIDEDTELFIIKKTASKATIYSSELVREITEEFKLDFEDTVSITLPKAEYKKIGSHKVAIIKVN